MATHSAPADDTRVIPEAQEPEYLRFGFSIVGVQKSGTTTLASTLKRHPQIAPAPRKEMTFFINERHDWSDPLYDEKYRLQRKRPRHLVVGDSTPAYPLRQAMASAEVIYGAAPTAPDVTALAEGYAADLELFRRLSGLDVSRWPTVQVLAGELDPGEFAAKLARKVRPVEDQGRA